MRVNADLSARRVAGATSVMNSIITERKAWTRFDDQTANVDIGFVGVIPTPPMNGEGLGLGEVGYLKHVAGSVFYARSGKADVATGMGAPTAMGFAATRWEMAEVSGSVLKRRSYQCTPGVGGFPASCGFTPVQQFTDVGVPETVSVAVGERCSIYSYVNGWGVSMMRVEPWATSCGNKACPDPWSEALFVSEMRVATDGNNRFVQAARVGASSVEVRSFTLDENCLAHGYTMKAFAIPAGSAFKPVSLEGSSALVWLDGTSLKVSR